MSQQRVFLSYSHRDEAWMNRILDFFSPVIQRDKVALWVDTQIQPGALWREELHAALGDAELAILLISPHYLTSDFIQRVEIPPLLQAATAGKTRLFLIPISDSAFDYTPLEAFQCAWDPKKPLDTLPEIHVKTALREILDRFAKQLGLVTGVAAPDPQLQAMAGTALVPKPGPLPAGSSVPFSPNPHFVGRDAELLRLAELLDAGKTAVVGQAWTSAAAMGLGGIGKTQLAVEFAWRYGQRFSGGVFWLHCADPELIAPQLNQIGAELGLHPRYEQLSPEQQLRLMRQALDGPQPRLLILDNCEDEGILARWRPGPGGCRVLLTSRKGSWSAQFGVAPLGLNALARGASVQLLQALCPRLSRAEADALAELLGDLPLALELAGRYQQRYYDAVPPAQLLAELRAQLLAHEALGERPALPGQLETLPTAHQRALATTFARSWDALGLQPCDRAARGLLARAAQLAPSEPIPRAFLLELLEAEPRERADGLSRLLDLGLLSSEQEGPLSIHRLIAAYARAQCEESEDLLRQEVGQKLRVQASKLNEAGLPKALIPWRTHLAELTERTLQEQDAIGIKLAHELGRHWYALAEWSQAEGWFRRGLAQAEKQHQAGDPLIAVLLNNLASLLQATNQLGEAEPMMRRALAINEASFGSGHRNVARNLNNLALLLHATNRLGEAERLMRRAFSICHASLGPDHPNTRRMGRNLSVLSKKPSLLARFFSLIKKVFK